MKRYFDFILALALAPAALLLSIIAAIPIALECRGAPFFVQTRLGRNERPFRLLKIRTMHISAPSAGSHEVGSQYILVSGRVLRKFKIDELPQIWNVLNGTMSFIGPRPGLPNQHDLTAARRQYGVFDLTPGITGISQINGIDMSTPEKLAASDMLYNRPWSFLRDLNILALTIRGKGSGDAAAQASSR